MIHVFVISGDDSVVARAVSVVGVGVVSASPEGVIEQDFCNLWSASGDVEDEVAFFASDGGPDLVVVVAGPEFGF